MPGLRRPLVLFAAAALAVGAAVVIDEPPSTAAPSASTQAATPVLSARRVPLVLLRPQGDHRLALGLKSLVDQSPPDTCLLVTEGNRTIVDHDADHALPPASNEKLLTAYAALTALGPDAKFRTSVVSSKAATKGTIDGDLYLVGGGDPVLTTNAFLAGYEKPPAHTNLYALADAVTKAGVTTVTGDLVGVDGRYDEVRRPPGWPTRDMGTAAPGALSALAVNRGLSTFASKPDEQLVPQASSDPTGDTARALRDLLEKRGVHVQGSAHAASSGQTLPAGATSVATVDSPPLSDIVRTMLTYSDNTIAELLTKELGVRTSSKGTTDAGAAAIASILRKKAVPTKGLVVADGSGLDDADRASCRTIAAVLLASGPDSPIGTGLPVAGETGTLKKRFLHTPGQGRLHAKTGSLDESTALSGYVDTVAGPTLTFSYVASAAKVTDETVSLQDLLAAELPLYPEGPSPSQIGP
jgi:D-alanyl-D-alanine carboxypeptidase/D-alanyl-D-alanine-endopeptidase (penicillin-binding protein 4)